MDLGIHMPSSQLPPGAWRRTQFHYEHYPREFSALVARVAPSIFVDTVNTHVLYTYPQLEICRVALTVSNPRKYLSATV